jgi:hypothetical protein
MPRVAWRAIAAPASLDERAPRLMRSSRSQGTRCQRHRAIALREKRQPRAGLQPLVDTDLGRCEGHAMSSPRPDGSGFRTFWTSLPGVLTGVAAVVGAVATLAGVFGGGGDGGGSRSPATATSAAQVTASRGVASTGDGSCLDRFLSGIPADRRARVEVGAEYATVIPPHRRPSVFLTWRPSGSRYFARQTGRRCPSTRVTWPETG